MKNYVIVLVVLLSISTAFAQNKKEKSKEGEDINQTIDRGIEQLSKGFDGLFKNNKKSDTKETKPEAKPTENSQKTSDKKTSEESPDKQINDFFKRLSFDGKPKSSYTFTSSYIMKMTFTDAKNTPQVMRTKYMFEENGEAVGTKFLSSTNGDMDKMSKTMDATIIDFKQSALFTFMNNDGKKSYMGVGVKDYSDKNAEATGKEVKITPLGKTKIIANYVCDGYLMQTESGDMTLWVSQRAVPMIAKYSESFNRMARNQQFGNKSAFNYSQNKELAQFAKDGKAVLGFDSVGKKGEQTSMEVESIAPSDNTVFNASLYISSAGGK